MNEILAGRVAPVHEAGVPNGAEWVALPKEVVLTPIKNRAVDIIAPTAIGGEMKLRPFGSR